MLIKAANVSSLEFLESPTSSGPTTYYVIGKPYYEEDIFVITQSRGVNDKDILTSKCLLLHDMLCMVYIKTH